MATDLLMPPAARAVPPAPAAPRPDPAVAALPHLARLRDALVAAAPFRAACRAEEARAGRWGVPDLFFFRRHAQAAWDAVRPTLPRSVAATIARKRPAAAAAWGLLPDLIADATDRMLASAEVRHAARAVAGLTESAAALADHPTVGRLAGLLAVPDDEVILVLHPAAGLGWRVRVRGVADVAQFHALLADRLPAALPGGPLPSLAAVAAYRGGFLLSDPPEVEARFQLYRPQGIRPDGTLPDGLAGCDHWLWGHRPLAAIPAVDGERVVLLGNPAYRAAWDAEPKFPGLAASADVVSDVSTAAVDDWLRDWCGAAPIRLDRSARRAA